MTSCAPSVLTPMPPTLPGCTGGSAWAAVGSSTIALQTIAPVMAPATALLNDIPDITTSNPESGVVAAVRLGGQGTLGWPEASPLRMRRQAYLAGSLSKRDRRGHGPDGNARRCATSTGS